jgi:cation transport ATPase
MLTKIIVTIFIYVLAVIIGGLTAGILSTPFIYETKVSILKYSLFLGGVTLMYSIYIVPVIVVFHVLVYRFLPQLYLLNFYPVFAYVIFGVNHFLAGFTFFSNNYWPIRLGSIHIDHLIVLTMAAALSGSTAIYANIGLEKIKNYYQKSNA